MNVKKENPYLIKSDDSIVITDEGHKKLSELVTDPVGQVYAFNGELSPVIIAAAMARLSRRMGDMRVALLDEFILTGDEDAEALIKRVVSGFGDDSVQQLIGLQFVVEGASNLLTKLLEWGRFASYLEQSTRYIFFDKKDEDGKWLYYIPNIDGDLLENYVTGMDNIFESYSNMVRGVTKYLRNKHPEPSEKKERNAWLSSTRATACDAVRPVLPVATKSTVGIFASSQAVERLIMNLLSEPLPEARIVGKKILNESRKIIPAFLERADLPERGGAITAHRANTRNNIRALARGSLYFGNPQKPSCDVKLISFWPNNELDLVSEILFEHAEPLSISEIQNQVRNFEDGRKEEILRSYMGERLNRRHRPGRAFEKAHFEWEIDGKDYGTFRDLQRHRVVDAWEWQRLSPYFGYEIPPLISEAGFESEFIKCFELSEHLYETLRKEDDVMVQYAVLFGHRMRYRFVMNLRQMFHFLELRTGPDGHPGYRKICNRMYEILKGVYPISANSMKFVNQREDEELTRLASERATQYKLEKLDSLDK
jgi:thymidylate synthase ThyX